MKAEIEDWMVGLLSRTTGSEIPAIAREQPIFNLGVTSLQLASLTASLAAAFGIELDSTLFYEHVSVSDAAAYVASRLQPPAPAAAPTRAAEPSRPRGPFELAIVGIACRMPGAPDKDAFWRLLREGRSGLMPKSPRRIRVEAGLGIAPSTGVVGGFLEAIDEFDASFFRISPAEAACMDPQQRLLLQVAWDALQDAGMPPSRLRKAPVGVFVGISHSDYGFHQFRLNEQPSGLAGPGSALAVAANRISYTFDLIGPSLAIDTACSSSLAALHTACGSLHQGDCSLALVAGVNLVIGSPITAALEMAGFLSPDGRCAPFEVRANGYVRGEGCGVVVVKPLDQALRDQDRIYAVVKGTAISQDGRSAALTAPNLGAQEAVLAAACRRAGLAPSAIDYVEAHGTGTPLGDPVEAMALGRVAGKGRPDERPLLIGSLKANIGHLEAAAGIAGLIKVALALHEGELPPQPGFVEGNPHIDFTALGLAVVRRTRPWPTDKPICGVSSFGFGGTNVHAILEGPPTSPRSNADERPVLVAVSAPCEDTWNEQAIRWIDWIDRAAGSRADICLPDIGFTSVFRRERLAVTRGLVVGSLPDLRARLSAMVEARRGGAPRTLRRRVAFHYPSRCVAQEHSDGPTKDKDLLLLSTRQEARRHAAAVAAIRPPDIDAPAWQRMAELQIGLHALLLSHGVEPAAVSGDGPGRLLAEKLYGAHYDSPAPDDIVVCLGDAPAGGGSEPGDPLFLAAWAPGARPSDSVLAVIAHLVEHDHPLKPRFLPSTLPRVASLPSYAWRRDRFWFQIPPKAGSGRRPNAAETRFEDIATLLTPAAGCAPGGGAAPARPSVEPEPADPSILAASLARGATRGAALKARTQPNG